MSTPVTHQRTASGDVEQQQHIHLACKPCQRKKIKCDRNFPCGQCGRSNIQCVPSQRKPRTRHVGKRAIDSELRNRISKLESLVDSLSGEVAQQDAPLVDEDRTAISLSEATSPKVGKYIASPFWSSLSDEIQALRDVLEDDVDDDDVESPTTNSGDAGQQGIANTYDLIFCPPGAVYVMPGALSEPSPQMQSVLYAAFIQNVGPMFKVHHTPSLRRFLERGDDYLGLEADALPNKLLKASLWFSAVQTIPEAELPLSLQQAGETFVGQTRASLSEQYRRCVEVLLVQADLMNTTEMATLQAFATYLVCLTRPDHVPTQLTVERSHFALPTVPGGYGP